MKIKSFVFNPFMENTYVLYNDLKEAIIIDPGCYESFENRALVSFIEDEKLKPVAVLNTHCHIDHVLGNDYLCDHYHIPLWIPEKEKEMLEAVKVYAPTWGITGYKPREADKLIQENETIKLGTDKLKCLFAPGHAPGHLMFYHEKDHFLIVGDVIFRESIGRTDLPGGDYDSLIQSIRERVYTLPDNTLLFPGHGPTTTIAYEKKNNPFVKG